MPAEVSMRRTLVPLLVAASAALAADSTEPFGQDPAKAIRKGAKDPNVVFSPSSIAQVLELAKAGARGATKDEIEKVSHGAPAALAHEGVSVANHIWAQRGFGVREDFKVDVVDFKADPEK